MSAPKDAPEAELTEARAKLDESLKTCRALMNDYRTVLAGDPVPSDVPEIAQKPTEKSPD